MLWNTILLNAFNSTHTGVRKQPDPVKRERWNERKRENESVKR